jgi:outer membrane biosynthesis protein TonB
MSTSSSSGSPGSSSVNSTRHLLDELDALMQRMLALPVEQDEAVPPATAALKDSPALRPVPAPVVEAPVPTVTPARPKYLEIARPEPAARPAPNLVPASKAAEPARKEVLAARLPAPAAAPPEPAETGPADTSVAIGPEIFAGLKAGPALLQPRPALSRPRPALRRPERSRGWLLGSLYWTNRAFDRGTRWLGGPGRWLRSPGGRSVLGWFGIGLLTVALGWQVLAWLGWTW